MLVFVFDEEDQSRGAKLYAQDHPNIDYVVVGEPTANVVAAAHKGCLRVIMEVKGEPAHSGTPDLGINAIFKAAGLIGLLEQHDLNSLCQRHHALVGRPSLTITRITEEWPITLCQVSAPS